MNRQKIEDKTFHFPKEERVQLFQRGVLSLESVVSRVRFES